MTEETVVKTDETKDVAKIIGYSIWKSSYNAANPQASDEDRAAAWAEARNSQVRAGKLVLKALEKAGYSVVNV